MKMKLICTVDVDVLDWVITGTLREALENYAAERLPDGVEVDDFHIEISVAAGHNAVFRIYGRQNEHSKSRRYKYQGR